MKLKKIIKQYLNFINVRSRNIARNRYRIIIISITIITNVSFSKYYI